LKISPHLAYGETGIPGKVPAQAVIIAEIEFIEERKWGYEE
jgi:FKBP-type peptidyl-prolyl cis-trans isomerase